MTSPSLACTIVSATGHVAGGKTQRRRVDAPQGFEGRTAAAGDRCPPEGCGLRRRPLWRAQPRVECPRRWAGAALGISTVGWARPHSARPTGARERVRVLRRPRAWTVRPPPVLPSALARGEAVFEQPQPQPQPQTPSSHGWREPTAAAINQAVAAARAGPRKAGGA